MIGVVPRSFEPEDLSGEQERADEGFRFATAELQRVEVEAGLIYSVEPVLTSILALFLPACISMWAGIHYANETLTARLLIGGGLVTAANVLVQKRQTASQK